MRISSAVSLLGGHGSPPSRRIKRLPSLRGTRERFMARSSIALPKRAIRHEIERQRARTWFEVTGSAAVRVLCAPVGSGKTIAVKQYAAGGDRQVLYTRVPQDAGVEALRKILVEAKKYGELILDDADRLEPQIYSNFVEEICSGQVDVKLVLVGRSRRRLAVQTLLARGVAAAYDPPSLAFDVAEIAELADAFGVPYDETDIGQTLYDTEGWTVAVEWLIRDAAETSQHLRDAFIHWRDRNGHLLLEFVENERYAEPHAFDTYKALLTSAPGEGRVELERLEQVGLPLTRTRAGARPYRILRRLAAAARGIPADRVSRTLPPVMMLNLLGQFRCEIAGKPVAFSRRRDQNVFVFVALSLEGYVHREAVLQAFWPGIDHRIAAQGLRTTISRIRHAIAQAAPDFDPEVYFQTASDLRIDASTVTVDVRRFVELIEQARADDSLGVFDSARRHYRLAYCMYKDRLLASEAPETCFERSAQQLSSYYVEALSRLTQLHAASGDLEAAREYAREFMACNRESVAVKA
jgi:tetratricopeptide (TPR) repeat protein